MRLYTRRAPMSMRRRKQVGAWVNHKGPLFLPCVVFSVVLCFGDSLFLSSSVSL